MKNIYKNILCALVILSFTISSLVQENRRTDESPMSKTFLRDEKAEIQAECLPRLFSV